MADLPWFRFYNETANDVKFKRIARDIQADPLTVIGAWTLILCIASKSPVRGKLLLTKDEPYTIEDLSDVLHWREQDTEVLIDAFIRLGMIACIDDAFEISHWGDRQYESDSSRDRVKKYRDRTSQERYSNVTVTLQESESDTESESESESDSDTERDLKTTSTLSKNIFQLYEQNIGPMTPFMAEKLKAAEKEYPPDWIPKAFEKAVEQNVRKWAYIHRILENWRRDGFSTNGTKPAPRQPTLSEQGIFDVTADRLRKQNTP